MSEPIVESSNISKVIEILMYSIQLTKFSLNVWLHAIIGIGYRYSCDCNFMYTLLQICDKFVN